MEPSNLDQPRPGVPARFGWVSQLAAWVGIVGGVFAVAIILGDNGSIPKLVRGLLLILGVAIVGGAGFLLFRHRALVAPTIKTWMRRRWIPLTAAGVTVLAVTAAILPRAPGLIASREPSPIPTLAVSSYPDGREVSIENESGPEPTKIESAVPKAVVRPSPDVIGFFTQSSFDAIYGDLPETASVRSSHPGERFVKPTIKELNSLLGYWCLDSGGGMLTLKPGEEGILYRDGWGDGFYNVIPYVDRSIDGNLFYLPKANLGSGVYIQLSSSKSYMSTDYRNDDGSLSSIYSPKGWNKCSG